MPEKNVPWLGIILGGLSWFYEVQAREMPKTSDKLLQKCILGWSEDLCCREKTAIKYNKCALLVWPRLTVKDAERLAPE